MCSRLSFIAAELTFVRMLFCRPYFMSNTSCVDSIGRRARLGWYRVLICVRQRNRVPQLAMGILHNACPDVVWSVLSPSLVDSTLVQAAQLTVPAAHVRKCRFLFKGMPLELVG